MLRRAKRKLNQVNGIRLSIYALALNSALLFPSTAMALCCSYLEFLDSYSDERESIEECNWNFAQGNNSSKFQYIEIFRLSNGRYGIYHQNLGCLGEYIMSEPIRFFTKRLEETGTFHSVYPFSDHTHHQIIFSSKTFSYIVNEAD